MYRIMLVLNRVSLVNFFQTANCVSGPVLETIRWRMRQIENSTEERFLRSLFWARQHTKGTIWFDPSYN